jgi:hypothetical protein
LVQTPVLEVTKGGDLGLEVELLEFENKVAFVYHLLTVKISSETQPYTEWKNIQKGNTRIIARAVDASSLVVCLEPMLLCYNKDISIQLNM